LRQRAFLLYQSRFRALVSSFTEADATQLASLISELKTLGQQMKFFDAGIAATALARGDKLLVLDSDFDRLKDRIKLLRSSENSSA
jgi:predicted nucleic acid-binding protein